MGIISDLTHERFYGDTIESDAGLREGGAAEPTDSARAADCLMSRLAAGRVVSQAFAGKSIACALRGVPAAGRQTFRRVRVQSLHGPFASIPQTVCLGWPIPEPSCPSVRETKPVVLSKKISFRIHFFQTNLRQFDAKECSLALHECHDLMPCHEISNVIRITFPILIILGLRRLFFN